jgi:molecular chaperone GrpE (heat shock protein)
LENILSENAQLKSELAKLKEDFERLHAIFEISKNATKNDNHEVDVELSNLR